MRKKERNAMSCPHLHTPTCIGVYVYSAGLHNPDLHRQTATTKKCTNMKHMEEPIEKLPMFQKKIVGSKRPHESKN